MNYINLNILNIFKYLFVLLRFYIVDIIMVNWMVLKIVLFIILLIDCIVGF